MSGTEYVETLLKSAEEENRAAILSTYKVLDTLEEEEFDALTQIASVICGTPIALISLLDNDRQWFKSHHGISATETPISMSFCAHAVTAGPDIMIIEDPTKDERFKNNPLVTGDPHIGFYAGVPLIGEDQVPLGTLCVIDHYPRTINEDQKKVLRTLATQVMDKLELRRKIAYLQAAEHRLNILNDDLIKSERSQQLLVEERTAELEVANAALKRSNEDLLQFAHVSSHDLKEPLRKIKYFNNQLTTDELALLSPRGKDAVLKIDKSVNRVLQIVDDVLTYSRDLSADANHGVVDLDELVHAVREDLSLRLSAPGIELITNELGLVSGSTTQLYQLFLNLVSNALKFAHHDRPLNMHITMKMVLIENTSFKQLVFSDNGIGFDPGYSNKIFSAFTRLHSKDRYEGTGIGLSLCKKIVDRHGGTIIATGIEDKGASFTILLPCPRT